MTVRAWQARTKARATVSLASAARELCWPRRKLELAVQLGVLRSVGLGELAPWGRPVASRGQRAPVVPGASWQRRVLRSEVERLAADPRALRESRGRLRLVGTAQAAELVEFAAGEPQLSAACAPERLRAMMRTEADWRGRNWRARRVGQLLTHSSDPWSRAAVSAAVLSTDALADAVPDLAERAYLRELDPPLSPVRAVAPAVCAVVDEVVTADDRDEVIWHQIGLTTALEDARPAPPAAAPATGVAAAFRLTPKERGLPVARPAALASTAGRCGPSGRRPSGRAVLPRDIPGPVPGEAGDGVGVPGARGRGPPRPGGRAPSTGDGAGSARGRRHPRADARPPWPGRNPGTHPGR